MVKKKMPTNRVRVDAEGKRRIKVAVLEVLCQKILGISIDEFIEQEFGVENSSSTGPDDQGMAEK
jgi:hypothetical protein